MWKLVIALNVLLLANLSSSSTIRRSFLDNLNSGIKLAGQFFGIDAASDVADLVSQTFSNKPSTKKNFKNKLHNKIDMNGNVVRDDFNEGNLVRPQQETSIINGIFRLMGLDGAKLGAMAVNGIIFLARMIANQLPQIPFLAENQTTARDLSFSPLDWILDNKNEKFKKLLEDVRDKNLNVKLINFVEEYEENNGDADCIKLLICKITPFLRSMQDSLNDRIDGKADKSQNNNSTEPLTAKVLFKYLPDWDEFKNHGDACEEKYDKCKIYN